LIPPAARVLVDLGSGAGFPGMVLAIMARGIQTHLIESNHRRVTFLREVSRETGAAAIVHAARIETVVGLKADVVTARALAPLPRLIDMARPFCGLETTCLFLKGQHIESELTGPTKSTMMRAELLESLADPAGRIVRLRGDAGA
jgi:16S rRNA (guanine527-N7)-methyltransferase